jgi:hypothetical protein
MRSCVVQESFGSVSYENNGEHFFLVYLPEGVEPGCSVKEGDLITFVRGRTARYDTRYCCSIVWSFVC